MKRFIQAADGILILSFLIILLSILTGLDKSTDNVIDGAADVHGISDRSAIELNGQWEFYRSQLLTPVGRISNPGAGQLISVPSDWTRCKDASNHALPVTGYGVYRIVVKTAKGQALALKLPQIGSCYRLWVNRKILYSSGRVGKSAEESVPRWSTAVVNFTAESDSTEIMLEVANFDYFRAGITSPILLGTDFQIQRLKYRGLFMDCFIFAALTVMAVFFILLYVVYARNKSYLFLSLFSIAVAIRPLLYGECYFNTLFPNIGFEPNTKIYLANFIIIQLLFFYFYYQYEGLLSRKTLFCIGLPILAIIAGGILLPARYMNYPVLLLEATIPVVVAICVRLLLKARKKGYEGAGLSLLSISLLTFLGIVDILTNDRVISLNVYYTPIALLIIAFIQTFLQVGRFRENVVQNNKLKYDVEINNLKLEYEVKQRAFTEKLNNGLKAMVSTLETDELLTGILGNLHQIIPFDRAVLALRDKPGRSIIAVKVKDGGVKRRAYEGKMDFDGPCHAQTRMEELQIRPLAAVHGTERSLIVKRLYFNGQLLGILKILVSQSRADIREAAGLIGTYCEQSALALQNAMSYKSTKEIAKYDDLTGTYNRRYLMEVAGREFDAARQRGESYAALMLDIDHFKRVNDTYGHIFGDRIIKSITATCKQCAPSGSVIGRYGGEEFLLFIRGMALPDILAFAEALRERTQSCRYRCENGGETGVTISIGVAMISREDATVYDLINHADKALYDAKNTGRNRVSVFGQRACTGV